MVKSLVREAGVFPKIFVAARFKVDPLASGAISRFGNSQR